MALRHALRQLHRASPSLSTLNSSVRMPVRTCDSSPCVIHRQLLRSPQNISSSLHLVRRYCQVQLVEDDEEAAAEEIRNLSPELKYKLDLLKLQHIIAVSQFRNVLEEPSDAEWLYMLKHCRSEQERLKHMMFLQTKKVQREKKKRKQEAPKEEVVEHRETLYDSIMLRVMENQTALFRNNNLFYAMMNGPDVVLDLGFCETQPMRAVKRVFIQLGMMIGANKKSRTPFHLHLCGVSDSIREQMSKIVIGLEQMPITISKESYLECYPRESLVYLSPDSPHILKEYNGNDVYIIGGLVDLAGGKFSYPKAKEEGIRSAKLPLELYVDWKQGNKCLTLDQVYKILLTAAETKSDWDQAFTHIPKRKVEPKERKRKR